MEGKLLHELHGVGIGLPKGEMTKARRAIMPAGSNRSILPAGGPAAGFVAAPFLVLACLGINTPLYIGEFISFRTPGLTQVACPISEANVVPDLTVGRALAPTHGRSGPRH